MSEFTMIDKKGQWVRNTSEFGLPDYQRHSDNPGTSLIVLQPGVATKIELNDYLRSQKTLEILTVDPITGDDIVPPKAKAPKSLGKVEPEPTAEEIAAAEAGSK